MNENLSFKNIFKRETKLASYIIICLTIVVLSLSYAMFFRVNGNSENQVVEAGDLVFTYENSSQTITNTNSNECFMPMSGEETSLYLGTCDYKLSVQNTGSLKGAYTLRLVANEDNTIDASYLKVVLRKQVGETLEIVEGYENGKTVSELTEGILIQDEEMETGSTVVYSIFLYLDESIITSLEESQINTIINGTISYQIEGTGLVHEGQDIDTIPYCEQNPETGACTILAKGETDELMFDNTVDNNLRYVGANPNNYVSFNNELWRIIGVMNNIDDGTGTKETRLKIIRNEPIGNYSWDNKTSGTGSSTSSYGSNDWSDSRLMMLLNPGYETPNSPIYEYEGSLYYNGKSGTCYSGRSGATVTCDFTNTGLQSTEAKEMIGSAVWKLGGLSDYSSSDASYYRNAITSTWYTYERGTEVYEGRSTEWTGKIGLMYASDYGYATSGGSTTNRETCLKTVLRDWNDYDDCFNNDWLYKSGTYQWTLTSSSSTLHYVFPVYSTGRVDYIGTYITHPAVSPALYLTSNVRISGGEGTESLPYTLSL